MGFCILGRVVAVLPLGLVTNGIKTAVGRSLPAENRHMLTWKHLFMMCHAGLRGGIALVLVLELGPWVDETEGAGSVETLRNATLVVIVGFLLIFGGTTQLCVKLLGIRMGDEVDRNELLYDRHEHGCFMRGLMQLRKKVVLPILVGTHNKKKTVHMHGGVMQQIIADHSEEPMRASSSRISRLSSSVQVREDVFDLFGTLDPDAAPEEFGLEEDARDSKEAPGAAEEVTTEASDVVPV